MRVDLVLACERDGFGQAFDHGGDHEIGGQLDHVGCRSVRPGIEGLLAEGIEIGWQRLIDQRGRAARSTNNFPAAAASGRPSTVAAT